MAPVQNVVVDQVVVETKMVKEIPERRAGGPDLDV
jgi:hypothetical protein